MSEYRPINISENPILRITVNSEVSSYLILTRRNINLVGPETDCMELDNERSSRGSNPNSGDIYLQKWPTIA